MNQAIPSLVAPTAPKKPLSQASIRTGMASATALMVVAETLTFTMTMEVLGRCTNLANKKQTASSSQKLTALLMRVLSIRLWTPRPNLSGIKPMALDVTRTARLETEVSQIHSLAQLQWTLESLLREDWEVMREILTTWRAEPKKCNSRNKVCAIYRILSALPKLRTTFSRAIESQCPHPSILRQMINLLRQILTQVSSAQKVYWLSKKWSSARLNRIHKRKHWSHLGRTMTST